MRKASSRKRRLTGWLLSLLVLAVWFSPQAQLLRSLPDTFSVSRTQTADLALPYPFELTMTASSSTDEQLGSATATISLFGLLPIREVEVEIADDLRLYPGGQAVGVAMRTKGVLVVGTSDLSGALSPARMAGIKPGDVITEADGQPVTSTDDLTQKVAAYQGAPLPLTVLRGEERLLLTLQARRDGQSGDFRIGAWVRDSTAGVGTLSFYGEIEPGKGAVYGALGHAITDADTQQILPVGEGEIMTADVVDVRKGQKGYPGELKGSFLRENRVLGTLTRNNPYGIYGRMTAPPAHPLYPDGLPIGRRSTVHEGAATILCTVDASGMREYAVEIVEVSRKAGLSQRSMVIRVTDPELLEKTGGIVQGMSGSPIIQDGKLIGAVTHVFVNDPTRGYGIFIENMLEAAG